MPSKGGGAHAAPGGGAPPAKRIIEADDPYAFGQNLTDIATGKVDVR